MEEKIRELSSLALQATKIAKFWFIAFAISFSVLCVIAIMAILSLQS